MTDEERAREIHDAITAQNWKHGGVLKLDVPEGVEMIASALTAARADALEEAIHIFEADYKDGYGGSTFNIDTTLKRIRALKVPA